MRRRGSNNFHYNDSSSYFVSMQLSVIIPTYNEASHIGGLLNYLKTADNQDKFDVIVVDGGSTDETVEIAKQSGVKVLQASQKGRNHQMNYGAEQSTGEILYFVHADVRLPLTFVEDVTKAVEEGYGLGCYRFEFNSDSVLLRFNAWCTHFDRDFCRGGDQTLFVRRDLFEEIGGYNDDQVIMEEYELMNRARKTARFRIIPKNVVVSARKYEKNSYLRVMFANSTVFMMYRFGASPRKLQRTYHKLLNHST